MNGMCRLDIINNGTDDAVAYLCTMQKEMAAAVYIRGGDRFNLTGIDDGRYELYFRQGQSWNASMGRFDANATSSRLDDPLVFETETTQQEIRSTWETIIMDEVAGGNIAVVPVEEEDFPI
jgi:hypothetical protein